MKALRVSLVASIAALSSCNAYATDYVTGRCMPSQVKFISSEVDRATASRVYVNIPYASLDFIQGGTSSSCVIVYFSAMVTTASTNAMYLIAALDDSSATGVIPSETIFASHTDDFQSQAVSFIFPSVAPGKHILRMRYLSDHTSNVVAIYHSNTIVYFAP
jgi:hypothetical protein